MGISVEGILNALQQTGPNDATTLPDLCDRWHVELIVEILGGNAQQFHALGITCDAAQDRGIHQWSHGIVRRPQVEVLDGRTFEDRFRRHPLGLHRAHHPCIKGGIDGGHRGAHLQRRHHGPKARTFLTSLIEDFLHQISAIDGVLRAKTHLSDFHQVRRQLFRGIPLTENIGHLHTGHSLDPLHQVVALGQDLLDAVFDAVVDGFDQVT